MKTKISIAALCMVATGAQADGVTHMSGYYTYNSLGGGTSLHQAGAQLEYEMGNFVLAGDVQTVQLASLPASTGYSFDLGYKVTPSALVYAGVARWEPGVAVPTAYRIGAQAQVASATLALEVSKSSNDTGYLVGGEYQLNDQLSFGVAFQTRANAVNTLTTAHVGYETERMDIRATVMKGSNPEQTSAGLDASYKFGGQYRALGSVVYGSGNGITAHQAMAGLGYQVRPDMWIDAKVGTGRASFGGGSRNVASLTVSFETGRATLLSDRIRKVQVSTLPSAAAPVFGVIAPSVSVGNLGF